MASSACMLCAGFLFFTKRTSTFAMVYWRDQHCLSLSCMWGECSFWKKLRRTTKKIFLTVFKTSHMWEFLNHLMHTGFMWGHVFILLFPLQFPPLKPDAIFVNETCTTKWMGTPCSWTARQLDRLQATGIIINTRVSSYEPRMHGRIKLCMNLESSFVLEVFVG